MKKIQQINYDVKDKENRGIQQLLPKVLYKDVRNTLDHASHDNRVTSMEAKQSSQLVQNLINELFQ